ncbi:MAG: hypothetical protein OEY19_10620, partial [Gammaproteobacteria bacterium]|nr:hypothetical protein [Gammaproteobacteria bacterium]
SGCFEPNTICMNLFIRHRIKVVDVLAGKHLSDEIYAARYQHSKRVFNSKDLGVFVVSRINNDKKEKLLNSQYFLEEHSVPLTRYCFGKQLSKYVSEIEDIIPDTDCFSPSAVYERIKYDTIELVAEKVESILIKEGKLIIVDYGYYYKGKFFSDDYEDDTTELCNSYLDEDKLLNDSRCNVSIEFSVVRFEVEKGYLEKVKETILIEIGRTRVGMDNVEMEFNLIEKSDSSILEWKYNVNSLKP